MKLEVGKTYVTRSGGSCQIIQTLGTNLIGSFVLGNDRCLFAPNGEYIGRGCSEDGDDPWDLVAEANTAGGSAHAQTDTPSERRYPKVGEREPRIDTPVIPHADLIRAVLDGRVVQARTPDGKGWFDLECSAKGVAYICNYPSCAADGGPRFRLKPEPLVFYAPLYTNSVNMKTIGDTVRHKDQVKKVQHMNRPTEKILQITIDPETGEGTVREAP